ncbi:NHLP-related RiPP peptide [Lysobacter sp. D1-1-M9]
MQSVALDTNTHVSAVARKRSAPLDPKAADRLLDLLSTDDAFRRLFRRDAQKALEQVGFVESPLLASPSWCFLGITKLASKAQITKARATLREMLTSGLSQNPIQLDVATATRLKRK